MTCHRSKPSVITLNQRTQPLKLHQRRNVIGVTLDRQMVPLADMVTDPDMTATVQRLHPSHITRRLVHVRFVLLHPVTTR